MSNKIVKDAKLNKVSASKEAEKKQPKRLQQNVGGSVGISARMILLTLGAIVVILSCVYVGYNSLRTKTIVTVKNKNGKATEYSIKNLGYYVYQSEEQYNTMYKSLYANYGMKDFNFWEQGGEDATNAADSLSESIIKDAQEDFILYQQAVSEGYEATSADKKDADKQTKEALKNMTKKQKLTKGLSKTEIYNCILKQVIGERYKKDKITSLKLDYKKIAAKVKKADYKQYDFQYYTVPTTKTNSDGKSEALSKEEIAKLKTKMSDLLKQAKKADDFTTLFGKDKDGKAKTSNDDGINFVENGQLIQKDGFDKKIDSKIKKLKVGEISAVLEGEDALYIIKLTGNTSQDSYNNAVKEAKTKAEEDAFKEEYSKNIKSKYKVKVNDANWENVHIGQYAM